MSLRTISIPILIFSLSAPSFAADTSTPARDTPAAKSAPSTSTPAVDEDYAQKAAGVWKDIDASIGSLRVAVQKKKYDHAGVDAAKIKNGIHWIYANPGALDPQTVRNFEGYDEMVRTYADMLPPEATKGNQSGVQFCFNKINQLVELARTAFNSAPPAVAAKKSDTPAVIPSNESKPSDAKSDSPAQTKKK